MNEFVLDASVSLSWCLEDEHAEYSGRVLRLLTDATAVVPGFWASEVANGFLVAERRGRTTPPMVLEAVTLLLSLPIRVADSAPAHTFQRVLDLARSIGISVYDAAYLELAIRLGLPLADSGRRMRAAALQFRIPDAAT